MNFTFRIPPSPPPEATDRHHNDDYPRHNSHNHANVQSPSCVIPVCLHGVCLTVHGLRHVKVVRQPRCPLGGAKPSAIIHFPANIQPDSFLSSLQPALLRTLSLRPFSPPRLWCYQLSPSPATARLSSPTGLLAQVCPKFPISHKFFLKIFPPLIVQNSCIPKWPIIHLISLIDLILLLLILELSPAKVTKFGGQQEFWPYSSIFNQFRISTFQNFLYKVNFLFRSQHNCTLRIFIRYIFWLIYICICNLTQGRSKPLLLGKRSFHKSGGEGPETISNRGGGATNHFDVFVHFKILNLWITNFFWQVFFWQVFFIFFS